MTWQLFDFVCRVRDDTKKQKCNDLDRVDADDETIRIATKSIRKELHRAVDESVHCANVKDARKQLLDKVHTTWLKSYTRFFLVDYWI